MEAKELMVGDIVKQKHSGLILKVSAVVPPYIIAEDEDGQAHEDTVEPIPLSAEFFDNIGWHRMEGCKYDKRYFWADDFCEMTAHEFNDGMWHVEHDCIEMGGIPIECVNIGWVHELQHFITHCSVDMEIKLKNEDKREIKTHHMHYLELWDGMTLTQMRTELERGQALYSSMVGTLYKGMLADDLNTGYEWLTELFAERKGMPEWEAYHTFDRHGIFKRFRDEMYDRMYSKKNNF